MDVIIKPNTNLSAILLSICQQSVINKDLAMCSDISRHYNYGGYNALRHGDILCSV